MNVSGDDEFDEYDYVKEVLQDDQQYYQEEDMYEDTMKAEEQRRRQEQERQQRAAEEKERLAREEAEFHRREREAAIEAEMAKMNEDQLKAAKRQQKKDGKIVKRILKAAKHERHYRVLGLRNWSIQIRPRSLGFGPWRIRIPGFTLYELSTKKIKKAYRELTKKVHPDKNWDPLAEEAFIALEHSTYILSHEDLRAEYDTALIEKGKRRRQEVKRVASDASTLTKRILKRISWSFHRILGPFATPVIVLLALLI